MAYNPSTYFRNRLAGMPSPAAARALAQETALNQYDIARNRQIRANETAKVNPGAVRKLPTATGSTLPAPPSLLDQANSATQDYINQVMAAIDQQQQQARAQAEAEAEFERQKGIALAQGLQQLGIAPAVQNIFQGAGNNLANLAQGYSGDLQAQANADAAQQAHILSGTGQEAAVRNQGQNIGNVVYGLGGAIPGQAFNTTGAGYGALAALQPGFAEQAAQQAANQLISDYVSNVLPQFTQQKTDLIAKQPQILSDYLNQLVTLQKLNAPTSTAAAKVTYRNLANGQIQAFKDGKPFGKPVGPEKVISSGSAAAYRAVPYGNGQYITFDPNTGQAIGKPFGVPKSAKSKGGKTPPNLQWKEVSPGVNQWFNPKTGKPVGGRIVTDPNAGATTSKSKLKYTPIQISRFKKTAYHIAQSAAQGFIDGNGVTHAPWKIITKKGPNGKLVSSLDPSSVAPKQVLQDIIGEGVPFDIAVRAVAKFFPPAKNWLRGGTPAAQQTIVTKKNVSSRVEATGNGYNASTQTVQLPASFTGTHVTDGLGWGTKTAHDFMAPAGSPVQAPVSGTVLYFHPTGAQGGGSMMILGDDGYEYWLGHIQDGVTGGRIEAGQPIARVAYQNVSAPHVHIDRRPYSGRA